MATASCGSEAGASTRVVIGVDPLAVGVPPLSATLAKYKAQHAPHVAGVVRATPDRARRAPMIVPAPPSLLAPRLDEAAEPSLYGRPPPLLEDDSAADEPLLTPTASPPRRDARKKRARREPSPAETATVETATAETAAETAAASDDAFSELYTPAEQRRMLGRAKRRVKRFIARYGACLVFVPLFCRYLSTVFGK